MHNTTINIYAPDDISLNTAHVWNVSYEISIQNKKYIIACTFDQIWAIFIFLKKPLVHPVTS